MARSNPVQTSAESATVDVRSVSKHGARRLVELGLISLSFGSVYGTYLKYFDDELPFRQTAAGCLAAILAFWLSSQLKDATGNETEQSQESFGALLTEQFCFGAGLSLLAHALVTYGLLARRTPFLVVGGSLLSAIAITSFRRLHFGSTPPARRVLMVGFDNLSKRLVSSLGASAVGVCGPHSVALPSGVPFLGGLDQFQEIVGGTKPTDILISLPGWERQLRSAVLLKLRMAGTRVTEVSSLYERHFSRVCCERLQPVDLALSSALRGDSRTMAIQAVYNNLFGLFSLVLLAPLMSLIAISILVTGGPGHAIESLECAGFQYIPFRLQRFRTTGAGGELTIVGRILKRFHLVNLPQLINVVRGDMALVGPRPVRSEFAAHLSTAMPFYAHRFSVKPGLVGWAEVHLSPSELRDTRLEIEYDLYYIKASSLWLDLEILSEQLPWGAARMRAAEEVYEQ